MTFHDLPLHPLIVRNLTAMGYRRPQPIQEQAIASLLAGRDVIGLAPTGTGKTAAFLCPTAHHLLSNPPASDGRRKVDPAKRLRSLVLCPTRELAVQVEAECSRIIAGTVLRSACAYGKVGLKPQREAIARGIDILVATPGRVRELLDADAMTLAHVRHLAIDEADRMLDLGFLPQIEAILGSIPSDRQLMLFTATMPAPVESLARQFLTDPARIEIGRHTTPVDHVNQHLVEVEQSDKVPLLLHMLNGNETQTDRVPGLKRQSALIFCRTRRRVGWVGTALQRNGVACGMIHGDRTQAQRLKTIEKLESGMLHVLVSTDVAARGLHLPAISTVINYDVPPNAEEYVHRIGRAAHGGGRGEAWTLLARADRQRRSRIDQQLELSLQPTDLEGFVPSASPSQSPPPALRSSGSDRRRKSSQRGAEHDAKRGTRPSRTRKTRTKKSRKSRSIPADERPGRGVVRPSPPADRT